MPFSAIDTLSFSSFFSIFINLCKTSDTLSRFYIFYFSNNDLFNWSRS